MKRVDKTKEVQFDSEKGWITFFSDRGSSYTIKFGEYARVVEELERRIKELEAKVARLEKEGS